MSSNNTPVAEQIETAAVNSWSDYEYREGGNLYATCYQDGFKNGAKWQAAQLQPVAGAIQFVNWISDKGFIKGQYGKQKDMWFDLEGEGIAESTQELYKQFKEIKNDNL